MTSSVAVKLEDEIRERLQALGQIKDRSTHWLMKHAIIEYLEKEEQYQRELQEDSERWQQYAETGEAISHDDMKAWLQHSVSLNAKLVMAT